MGMSITQESTSCSDESASLLQNIFCGKQHLLVTSAPISNPSQTQTRNKFESPNFASMGVQCEKSNADQSLVPALLNKRSKSELENEDQSIENRAEFLERTGRKASIPSRNNDQSGSSRNSQKSSQSSVL